MSDETLPRARVFGSDSLVPVSLIASFFMSFGGAVYYVSKVAAKAEANALAITELSRLRERSDTRLMDRLEEYGTRLGSMQGSIGAVEAKLDLVIELQQSSLQSKHRR